MTDDYERQRVQNAAWQASTPKLSILWNVRPPEPRPPYDPELERQVMQEAARSRANYGRICG